jgi:hypothetical protein
MILSLKLSTVMNQYLFYEGRTLGGKPIGMMTARNIAPSDQPPVWRVGEQELLRWMRHKGFKFYERVSLAQESDRSTEPSKNEMADSPEEDVAPDPGEE